MGFWAESHVWLGDDDLPGRVANPLWESRAFHAEVYVSGSTEAASASLLVSVSGEGERYGVDLAGQRPLFELASVDPW